MICEEGNVRAVRAERAEGSERVGSRGHDGSESQGSVRAA